jgi:CheY-like chemotaxis protein
VILDLTMPILDGFDFASEVRDRVEGRDLPILVTTARDLSSEDHARLNGKVQAILQKGSYSRDELLGEVRRRVAGRVRARTATNLPHPSGR